METIKAILALLMLAGCALAQENSVLESVEGDQAIGQGVLVDRSGDIGYAVTALHVVESKHRFSVRYHDGKRAKNCRVARSFKDSDVALILVFVLKGIEPVEINLEPAEQVEFLDKFRERKTIRRSIRECNSDFYDAILNPGDSGSGLFAEGKLVGIVSGGWFWMRHNDQLQTWPCRAGRLDRVAEELKQIRKDR